jgi:putative DNA primase/helicase
MENFTMSTEHSPRLFWKGDIALFSGYTETIPCKEVSGDWKRIASFIAPDSPQVVEEKQQGQTFLPYALNGKARLKENASDTNLLIMDIDGCSEAEFLEARSKMERDGLTYIAFTTHSQGDKEGMRVRIVMPLNRTVNVNEYELLWKSINTKYFKGQADSSGSKVYQMQGAWCCHPDRTAMAQKWANLGELIVVDDQLPKTDKLATYPPSDANKVADACHQIRAFRDNRGAGQSEPVWYDNLGVVGHCIDGERFCHEWSSGHDGYNENDTAKKIANRLKAGPTTCGQFKKSNPEGCIGCTQTVPTPIVLGFESESVTVPYDEAVNPAELFDEITSLYLMHIIMERNHAIAVTLWTVMTWLANEVEVLPLLLINAPERSCGKTQLLDMVSRLSCNPMVGSNITTAALFRCIDLMSPTLLVDEADTFIKKNEEIQGLVNAGHTRTSAYVWRLVGDTHEPKQFSVWAPKAFAGINLPKHFSEATMSRGIVINMRRKLADESIIRIRRTNKAVFEVLKSKLARFAQDYSERIRHAQIDLPDDLSDRDQDNWEPLLTIAQCAGNKWLKVATEAALNLSKSENVLSINTELLSDIREIFAAHHEGKMSSADVIEKLVKDTEAPWMTWNKGKPLAARQLAKLLEPYGIKTKNLKFGMHTLKGFELAQFEDAFARYLAPTDLRNDEPKGYIFVDISV